MEGGNVNGDDLCRASTVEVFYIKQIEISPIFT